MRILVVEDESVIAQDIAWIVENEAGYSVAGIASTVDEALAIIAKGELDGAILDANLDGESSEKIAKELKQKNVPFFILSGYLGYCSKVPKGAAAKISAKERNKRLSPVNRASNSCQNRL